MNSASVPSLWPRSRWSEDGKQCPRCHILKPPEAFNRDNRRSSGRYPVCRQCESAYRKALYAARPTQSKTSKRLAARRFRKRHPDFYKDYYRKNTARVALKIAAYRKRNIGKFKLYWLEWARKNRSKVAEYHKRWACTPHAKAVLRNLNARRGARKAGAEGSHSAAQWEALKREHDFACAGCDKTEPGIRLTRDHIIPLSKGGTDFISNIQPLCRACNSAKKDRLMKTKYPRAAALAVARELCDYLKPFCAPDRLKVCGSLRRQKAHVGDVELVLVPRMEERQEGLFDKKPFNLAEEAVGKLLLNGVLEKRPNVRGIFTWGEKNKLAVHRKSGIPVDLFSAKEDNWWMTVVIRTGSAEHNIKLIQAASEQGLKLHAYGQFTHALNGEEVSCNSEEQVFQLAGIPYLQPHERL